MYVALRRPDFLSILSSFSLPVTRKVIQLLLLVLVIESNDINSHYHTNLFRL